MLPARLWRGAAAGRVGGGGQALGAGRRAAMAAAAPPPPPPPPGQLHHQIAGRHGGAVGVCRCRGLFAAARPSDLPLYRSIGRRLAGSADKGTTRRHNTAHTAASVRPQTIDGSDD